MKKIGAHVSASGGVQNAPLNAKNIGADAFALFVKNQRQWNAKPLDQQNIDEFKANLALANIAVEHILPHNSYLINLGHNDPLQRQKSINAFIDEIKRCEVLGLKMINFHPGSHLNLTDTKTCLSHISNSINQILDQTNGVKLVIENTAGQGSNLGYEFWQIAQIMEFVSDTSRVGVCLDTCHLFASGYDLRSDEAYAHTMSEFESLIGFRYLSGMHINDSKNDLGSKKDRHDSLGKGYLGLSSFEHIMKDDRIDDIPLILETIDESIWESEISTLRSLATR